MTTRMIQRRGLASQWTLINPILEIGEFGFEEDTQKFKMGDGESTWTQLPYFLNENLIPDVVALLAAANEDVQLAISTAVSTAVAGLVDSAPSALNTLSELASAIADDSSFANTITNAIANKADTDHTHTLDGLSDVSVSTATEGQFLKKNLDGSWGPATIGTTGVSYSELTDIPAEFPPMAHTHADTDIIQTVKTESGTSYSLISSDAEKTLRFTSATAVTLTVADVLTPGQRIDVYQKGAGIITFVPGSGVTLEAVGTSGGNFAMVNKFSAATIMCDSAGVYAIVGSVEIA